MTKPIIFTMGFFTGLMAAVLIYPIVLTALMEPLL